MLRLTNDRRNRIQSDYAWQEVISMTPEQLEDFAYGAIQEKLDSLSPKELIAFVDAYRPEIIERHYA